MSGLHQNCFEVCLCLLLVPVTRVVDLLVAQLTGPPRLTFTAEGRVSGGMTLSVGANSPLAWLAAWHHPLLQQELGEVLQLVINVEVSDTAVETGAVPPGTLT